jgi:hypothetical protein
VPIYREETTSLLQICKASVTAFNEMACQDMWRQLGQQAGVLSESKAIKRLQTWFKGTMF